MLRIVTMPDDPVTAIGKLQILHRGKESLGLQFDRLRKQPARAAAKDTVSGSSISSG